jgi:hypothetical protein
MAAVADIDEAVPEPFITIRRWTTVYFAVTAELLNNTKPHSAAMTLISMFRITHVVSYSRKYGIREYRIFDELYFGE